MSETSTKPYLLRALYEWCTDNGYTPHIAVRVDSQTRVPREFVRDGEIVLNVSFDATSSLQMGNETIEFSARFSGRAHRIEIPVDNVLAIYARENGQGMAFPVEDRAAENGSASMTPRNSLEEVPGLLDEPLFDEAPGSSGEANAEADADPTPEPDGPGGNDAPRSGRPHLKVIK
jgi:stringent starvation protein B